MEGQGHPPNVQPANSPGSSLLQSPRRSPRFEREEAAGTRGGGGALVEVAPIGRIGVGRTTGRGRGVRGGRGVRPPLLAGRGRGGGRAGSGPRFNIGELDVLNDILERVLPLGPDEWEQVAVQHAEVYPTHNQSVANLKRKFRDMCSHTPPTGDPTCPQYIANAKRICLLIEQRSDADNLDGDLVNVGIDNVNDDDVEATESKAGSVPRRLFENVPAAWPLVRTPVSLARSNLSRPNDLMSVALASFLSNTKSDEAEKQYRQE